MKKLIFSAISAVMVLTLTACMEESLREKIITDTESEIVTEKVEETDYNDGKSIMDIANEISFNGIPFPLLCDIDYLPDGFTVEYFYTSSDAEIYTLYYNDKFLSEAITDKENNNDIVAIVYTGGDDFKYKNSIYNFEFFGCDITEKTSKEIAELFVSKGLVVDEWNQDLLYCSFNDGFIYLLFVTENCPWISIVIVKEEDLQNE